jgi:hypothetical protein
MKKVSMDVMQPWIVKRVFELLGFEDEVVPEFVFGLLEEQVCRLSYCMFYIGLTVGKSTQIHDSYKSI